MTGFPQRVTVLARVDWLLLIAFTFPVQIVQPFLLLFSPRPLLFIGGIIESAIQIVPLVIFVCVMAALADALLGAFRPATKDVPQVLSDRVTASLVKQFGEPVREIACSMRAIPGDLSLGAHVRGFFRPRLVVSGGMLMGLARGDRNAQAILAHELAHVQHHDRMLIAFVGMIVFEVVGRFIKFNVNEVSNVDPDSLGVGSLIGLTLYQLTVFSVLLSCVSRYREYYADARAIQLTHDVDAYRSLLSSGARHKGLLGNFFHPSISDRLDAIDQQYRVLRTVHFWKVYWLAAGSVGFLQWRFAEDSFVSYHGLCGAVMAAGLLVFEVLRPLLIGTGESSRPFSRGAWPSIGWTSRGFRYGFMLLGFTVVVVFADMVSPRDPSHIMAVGGAVVYVISRSMK